MVVVVAVVVWHNDCASRFGVLAFWCGLVCDCGCMWWQGHPPWALQCIG